MFHLTFFLRFLKTFFATRSAARNFKVIVSKLSLLPHFEGNSQKWIIDNSAAEIHEFTSSANNQ